MRASGMQARRLRAVIAAGVLAALTIGAAGCAESDRDSGGDEGKAATGGTFIFAGAGDPKNFDPIFNDDGESFRPIRQMYDTLITHKPGTAELAGRPGGELGARPDRQDLDVQAPPGREVPRRHARSTPRRSAATSTAGTT